MTNKKNIVNQILTFFAVAALALSPAAAQASEVTGTLSADGTVVITSTDDDGSLGGTVEDDSDGDLEGTVEDDSDGSLGGTVEDDPDGTLGGTVVADGDGGGGGSGGGGSTGGGGGDDDSDGDVLGATTFNPPGIPSAGAPLPLAQSFPAQSPGLPNAGEPYNGSSVLWNLVVGMAAAVFLVSSIMIQRKLIASER